MLNDILNQDVQRSGDGFTGLGERREDVATKQGQTHALPIVAACVFDGDLTGTNSPLYGLGIRSIVRTGTGVYTVVFNRPMITDRYIVLLTLNEEAIAWVTLKARESFTVRIEDNGSTAADVTNVHVAVILP